MELKKYGWQCRYVCEYLAVGEAPREIRNCFQQRSRWTKVWHIVAARVGRKGSRRYSGKGAEQELVMLMTLFSAVTASRGIPMAKICKQEWVHAPTMLKTCM